MKERMSRWMPLGLAVALLAPATVVAGPVAEVSLAGSVVAWTPQIDYEGVVLTVSGPGDFYLRRDLGADRAPQLEIAGFEDGEYSYELQLTPRIDGETRKALAEARRAGDAALEEELARLLPRGGVAAGYFTVSGGQLVTPGASETPAGAGPKILTGGGGFFEATVLTNADGVIRNSLCVGADCPNSPSFSDTTILMMENNTRIKFDDTSSTSSFPNRDWELQANSNVNGGPNRFALNDCGTSSQGGCAEDAVFAVEAGARTNALYVESDGDIGIGTSNPSVDIHIKTGNTPTVRLEQDGSSGFTPQTWDIAGNETNFFVRDVTHGSALPFRIQPDAPSTALWIDDTGDIGLNTTTPDASMEIVRSTGSNLVMLELSNNAPVNFSLENTSTGNDWNIGLLASGSLAWNEISAADGNEMTLDVDGNLVAQGTITPMSSREMKAAFGEVDGREVLARVVDLPVTTWNYKRQRGLEEARHMGPMAEDFHAAFGLGASDKGISVTDSAGVALAAIQGLYDVVREREAEISGLRELNAELLARLEKVETALAATAKAELD